MKSRLEKFKLGLAFRLQAQNILKLRKEETALKKLMHKAAKETEKGREEKQECGARVVEIVEEEVVAIPVPELMRSQSDNTDHLPGKLTVESEGIPSDLTSKGTRHLYSSLDEQLILPTRRSQKELLNQIWSVLKPGGKFVILAVIPIKRQMVLSKDTLLHGFGKQKVISDLNKWADELALKMIVREEKVFLTTEVWIEIYKKMKEHPRSWLSLLTSSSVANEKDFTKIANIVASKVDHIVVTLLGAKC